MAEDSIYLPLSRLKTQYEDYMSSKRCERDEADTSDRYYHGDHWTSAEIAKLNERGQPVITYNRVQRKIDGIVGLVERLRQDPKAYPRTPKHQDGAEIATQVLNYVLDSSRWKDISSDIARDASIGPLGGIELELVQGDQGDHDIRIHQLDKRRYFYDPRCRKSDFSDKRYDGTRSWIDMDLCIEMFPEKEQAIRDAVSNWGDTEGNASDYRDRGWINSNEKSVLLVEHWYKRKGIWRFCFYIGTTILQEGDSDYYDENGETMSRFIAFSASIDHDYDRYGFVRNLRGPQDEVNHRRSKGLHALNTIRIQVEDGVDDIEELRRELHKTDGIIVTRQGAGFQQLSNAEQAQGNLELLQEAKNEIETFGPNPALIGQGVDAKSGRAIALLQQAGIAELGPFLIAYRAFKTKVYRVVWAQVQRYWQSERWVRVTDDEGLAQFLSVNKLGVDEWGMPTIANALGTLDVDLIVDEGPDQVNSMADAFDTLVALAQQGAAVPPEVILELSSLPASVKKMVLGKLQQAQQPNPAQQQAQMLELREKEAAINERDSKSMLNEAKARSELTPDPVAMPDGPNPIEAAQAAAQIEESRSKTAVNYAKARNTEMETSLAPAHLAQKAVSDRARIDQMQQRQMNPA